MYGLRTTLAKRILLLLIGASAVMLFGCAPTTDNSDPDPHYYKGKQFTHKRTS